jgi:hypothetical protein
MRRAQPRPTLLLLRPGSHRPPPRRPRPLLGSRLRHPRPPQPSLSRGRGLRGGGRCDPGRSRSNVGRGRGGRRGRRGLGSLLSRLRSRSGPIPAHLEDTNGRVGKVVEKCRRHVSDFIVALNAPQYGNGYPGPNCFKQIQISANGKTATATIMDQCPG